MQWRIQGGFLGFRGTPLFIVLGTCVAGLVREHEHSQNVLGQQNPSLKILDLPLQCHNVHSGMQ